MTHYQLPMQILALLILLPSFIFSIDNPVKIPSPKIVEIAIEHAKTPNELAWGLMQRPSLSSDSGMLFIYPDEELRSFWMLNTQIDLSVAFIDRQKVIREIYEMKAYPHLHSKMAIKNINDLFDIDSTDPIVTFFSRRKTNSRYPAHYALEMNKQWFAQQNIKIGDVLEWDPNTSKASVIQTINLGEWIPSKKRSITFELPEKTPIALWLPDEEQDYHIIFLDSNSEPVQTSFLKGGKKYPSAFKPVLHTSSLVKYLLVTPAKINLE